MHDGERVHLVDLCALRATRALPELLANPRVEKILHAAGEDIEVFVRLGSGAPGPIFDTQIAAAMTGEGWSLGYGTLVTALLGVVLPKDEARSDWMARPLRPRQIEYAVLDVAYLPALYERLERRLRELGRLDWLREDCARLADPSRFNQSPALAYLRVRNAWRLDGERLAVLRELCAWRESEARARDVPRNHLVREALLMAVARAAPEDMDALRVVEGARPALVSRHGKALLAAVQRGLDTPPQQLPPPLPDPMELRTHAATIGAMKARVRARAAVLGMAPELLAQGRLLEALLRAFLPGGNHVVPEPLAGWRREVITTDLLALLPGAGPATVVRGGTKR